MTAGFDAGVFSQRQDLRHGKHTLLPSRTFSVVSATTENRARKTRAFDPLETNAEWTIHE